MQNLVLFIYFRFNIFKVFTQSCINNLGQNVFILWLSFCVFPDHVGFELTTPILGTYFFRFLNFFQSVKLRFFVALYIIHFLVN